MCRQWHLSYFKNDLNSDVFIIFVAISGLVYRHCFEQDKLEGIKGEIRSRKSNDRQYNGQKEKRQMDKQWSTKHYTEN